MAEGEVSTDQLLERNIELGREILQKRTELETSGIDNRYIGPFSKIFLEGIGRPHITFSTMDKPGWRISAHDITQQQQILDLIRPLYTDEEYREFANSVDQEIEVAENMKVAGRLSRDVHLPTKKGMSVRINPLVEMGIKVAVDDGFLDDQLQLVEQIYNKFTEGDSVKPVFRVLCNQTFQNYLNHLNSEGSKAQETKAFVEIVTSSISQDARFGKLEEEFGYDETNVDGISNVQTRVRELSQSNLLRDLSVQSKYAELPQLLSSIKEVIVKAGDSNISFSIPGFPDSFSMKDLLESKFWSGDFFRIVEFLIKSNTLTLVHNMHDPYEVNHNIQNGIGSSMGNIKGDVTEPYASVTEVPRVAYTFLGLDVPLYSKGAGQGGEGDIQMQLDFLKLLPRTIFFPNDTGDPQTMMDSNSTERNAAVLSGVGAAELFLIRHIKYLTWEYLERGVMDANSSKRIGNFGFIEGNVLGPTAVTKENVKILKRPKILETHRQNVDISNLEKRLDSLDIPQAVVE